MPGDTEGNDVLLRCSGHFNFFGGEFQQLCKNDLKAQMALGSSYSAACAHHSPKLEQLRAGCWQWAEPRGLGSARAQLSPGEFTHTLSPWMSLVWSISDSPCLPHSGVPLVAPDLHW